MSDLGFQIATLGLGGNIGDPIHSMSVALQELDKRPDCRVLAVSRLFRTPPWGKTDQSYFFNACALIETTLSPEALLDICLAMERSMKRERIERWGPRTLDIDVLTFADVKQDAPRLELPHPRMTGRGFVLMPLADVAPELVVDGEKVGDWLKQADIEGIEVADANQDWWSVH
ncbi:2-amino-4-hydroxy-6-hydroxymethyldihydropteridine diphosphokinase [Rhizobium grahamii]|uniref:2-amino-4-hydroxy-6-hydroxymethyldihydropteridine pyrophosphokinase n=2 Tax=Rhizobium TaxID=379 RepID=A0A5Q0C9B6_9HYPH|nr:2-amino-4-hydroxy-6-hydroxymethyldihydropteridine diphosphokinase [Rhizobium grahamii]QFY60269.1 2-amino-4-hydroxy-6-hydroxymethyldihydropteridine diphosphokinase [Rhizobium grahamii]QRM50607.1 2-amino-4-hydroxy-6-hydroxymethyldihydropteridine diphosphokinase [Rhizobium sp. BG6]